MIQWVRLSCFRWIRWLLSVVSSYRFLVGGLIHAPGNHRLYLGQHKGFPSF